MSELPFQRIYARAPNHLGDVVIAIPALRRLAERYPEATLDIWCPYRWAPVLEMANLPAAVIAFRRTRAIWRTAGRLRHLAYEAAYLFTPSFSTAGVVWLAGIRERRGTPTDGRSLLLTQRAGREAESEEHRASFYLRIADPDWGGGEPPVPRISVPGEARDQFRRLVVDRLDRPAVGIFPGSNAPARRWPEGRFTALAAILARDVGTLIVFGGPGEEVLAARLAAAAGRRGIDLGGRTSLRTLAAGLEVCDLLVTNDSGPMHMAGALGTPVVALFGAGNPKHTGPLGAPARILRHSTLPCSPCYHVSCPRRGPGTFLPEAQNECLQLISVDAVAETARQFLAKVGTSSDA